MDGGCLTCPTDPKPATPDFVNISPARYAVEEALIVPAMFEKDNFVNSMTLVIPRAGVGPFFNQQLERTN